MTPQQNKSVNLYCRQLAEAMGEQGLDIVETLTKAVDRPWTEKSVKELLFKDLLFRAYGHTSTTKASTKEISEIYEVLNRHTSQNWGIHVPFPSDEEIMRSQQ